MGLFPIIGQWAFDPDLLGRRMSFISGPRQVGKTTLALLTLKKLKQEQNYYNWDTIGVNRRFAQTPFFFLENIPEPFSESYPLERSFPRYWIIFDEFHKHPKWKKLLKGYYDELGHFVRFVVCGSARLDLFRQTGESLLGRYFLFRMFPLGPNDVVSGKAFDFRKTWKPGSALAFSPLTPEWKEAVKQLYEISGFPEPFLQGSVWA